MRKTLHGSFFLCAFVLAHSSLAEKISLSAKDNYDNSVVICDRCGAHLCHDSSKSTWAPVYATKLHHSLAFKLAYEELISDNNDHHMRSVLIRSPLFLLQSPCLVTSQVEGQSGKLQQVVCSSNQYFVCKIDEREEGVTRLAEDNNVTENGDYTCKTSKVCWSENESNPVPGCLAKPVPGTTRLSNMNVGSRIINGAEANIEDHPWAVYILIGNFALCGGSVIGKHLVLTAKHCTEYTDFRYHLLMGDANNSHVGAPMNMTDYNFILHPDKYADVAVIKLKNEIPFSSKVAPIALPSNESDAPEPNELVGIYGWGLMCRDPPTCPDEDVFPYLLQATQIEVYENQTYCMLDLYGDKPVAPQQKKLMFCAGGYTENERALANNVTNAPEIPRDACAGDSGGAVECYHDDGSIYVCGVVSIGPPSPECGKSPGAYMETYNPAILNWLRSVVANDSVWTGGLENEPTTVLVTNFTPGGNREDDNRASELLQQRKTEITLLLILLFLLVT